MVLKTFLIAILFSCLIPSLGAITVCGKDDSVIGLGGMTPDTQVRNGTSFSILCSLSKSPATVKGSLTNITSHDIVFDFERQRIPRDRVTIRDSMSASIDFPAVNVSDSGAYFCYLETPGKTSDQKDLSLVCSMKLEVGLPPTKIGQDNIFCISEEYENLTCSWTPHDYNTKTNYTLAYYYGGNSGDVCPTHTHESNSCSWTLSSRPPYRQSIKKIPLVLYSVNRYGNLSELFTINHFEIIRPGKVENLTVSLSSTSMTVSWDFPHGFDFGYPPGHAHDSSIPVLLFEVHVTLLSGEEEETDYDSRQTSQVFLTRNHSLKIDSGIFPGNDYRIRVRSKTTVSKEDKFWSPFAEIENSTDPAAPSRSPVLLSTFESIVVKDNKRNITIFWQPLKRTELGGPGFYYEIVVEETASLWSFLPDKGITRNDENDNLLPVLPSSLVTHLVKSYRESSLTLTGLSVESCYRITIFSVNDFGSTRHDKRNVSSSRLLIPRESDAGADGLETETTSSSLEAIKPVGVEVFFYGSSKYEVRWSHPRILHRDNCESYSVSWCINDHPNDVKCTGVLKTILVPADGRPTAYTFDMNGNSSNSSLKSPSKSNHYQFGVSTNYRSYSRIKRASNDSLLLSSGISWASCLIPIGIKKLDRIHAFQARSVNETAIRLTWKLPCQGLQAVISKYEVLFCEASLENHQSCLPGSMNRSSLQGGSHRSLVVSSLTPETMYRFVLRAFTQDTPGEESEAVLESTQSIPSSFLFFIFKVMGVVMFVLVTYSLVVFGWKQWKKFQEEIRVPIELPGKFANPDRLDLRQSSLHEDDEDLNEGQTLKMTGLIRDTDSTDGVIIFSSDSAKRMCHTDSGQGTDTSSESSEVNADAVGASKRILMHFNDSSFLEEETSFTDTKFRYEDEDVDCQSRLRTTSFGDGVSYSSVHGEDDVDAVIFANNTRQKPCFPSKSSRSAAGKGYVCPKDILIKESNNLSNDLNNPKSYEPTSCAMNVHSTRVQMNPISLMETSAPFNTKSGTTLTTSSTSCSFSSKDSSSTTASSSNDKLPNESSHHPFIQGSNGYVFLPSQLPVTKI